MNSLYSKAYIYFLLGISFLISNCQAQHQISIKGRIILHPGWKPVAYLIQPGQFNEIASAFRGQLIDSAEIKGDGSFAFKTLYLSSDKTLLQLVIQKTGNRFANNLMDDSPSQANYMPLVWKQGEEITLTADASAFHQSCMVQDPSPENQAIATLRDIRITGFAALREAQLEDPENDTLLLEKEEAFMHYAGKMMAFADTTSCFEAALVAVRWVSPAGDYERMPEFFFGQCEKWSGLYPEHPFTKQLCASADKKNLPVFTGDRLPDFELPLLEGDTVRLSELTGKQITLVDIWASWCAPCRKENREVLAPLWLKYKDHGFQIIAYSIDNEYTSWVNAIKKDGALWTHASHLTGDATPFLEALRITTIPANFIVDETGKVLAKNVYGEELQKLVSSYFR